MKIVVLSKAIMFYVLLLLPSINVINAQCMLYDVPLIERINQSSYIIEGEVKFKTTFWNSDSSHIFTSNIVEIKKVFKGTITTNELEIITEGGLIDDKMEVVIPSLNMKIGEVGIFFGELSTLSNTDLLSLEPYASELSFVKYSKLLGKAFDHFNKYDIYNELYYNIIRRTNKFEEKNTFDPLNYLNNLNVKSHNISSISPASLSAGKKDTLTINGTGFGASMSGSSAVLFRAADNGGSSLIVCPVADIISWSDTKIECYVPSGAGTGGVRVQDALGSQSTDSPILIINYNLLNVNATESPVGIMIKGSLGYTFKYSNNTSNGGVSFADHTSAKIRFEDALQTWRCNSGFNAFATGAISTVNTTSNNGEFVVMFDNDANPLSIGILGKAHSYYSKTNCEWMVVDIDIRFRRDGTGGTTWYFGTDANSQPGNSNDFQSVALHEIGHTHQQGHTINTEDPMHYSLITGTNTRTPTEANINGGKFVINNGIGKLATCTSYMPMVAFDCSLPPTANLFDINSSTNLTTIKIYPNPTSTNFTIEYQNFSLSSDYSIRIVNTLSQEVFSLTINQQKTFINLYSWLEKGIYVVQIIDSQNNPIENHKLIIH